MIRLRIRQRTARSSGKKAAKVNGMANRESAEKPQSYATKGEYARQLRNRLGLSQEQAGDQWHIAVRTIRAVETGRGASAATLLTMASKLGLSSWHDLLTDEERSRLFGDTASGRPTKQHQTLLDQVREHCYQPDGIAVQAIRLFGSAGEYLLEREVEVHYEHKLFDFQPEDRKAATAFVEAQRKKNAKLWNGPTVRLDRWAAAVPEGSGNARERGHLSLWLSGLGWFGYVGMNQRVGDQLRNRTRELTDDLLRGIGFESWFHSGADGGDFSHCHYSNIVGAPATLVTPNGYVGYLLRGEEGVAPGRCTSSIAENINRLLDDANPKDSRDLKNPGAQLVPGPEAEGYVPKGVPHPFAAVWRGIEVEGSQGFLPYLDRLKGVKLVGLAWDLLSLHPELLFAAFLSIPHEEALQVRRRNPGREAKEGRLEFLRADFRDEGTRRVLTEKPWNPGGMASLVRTIEWLQAAAVERRCSLEEAIRFLANVE
jgi:hypothetical protein